MSDKADYKKMHANILNHLKIDQYRVSSFSQNVALSKCNDELGLLPNWMFRADMISSMLLNERISDVAYIRNDEAISYLSFVDINEAVLSLAEKESYLNFSCSGKITTSLKMLISGLAITESLEINHEKREVSIKPIVGFFNMPANGQTLVFPSIQAIEAHRLHDMLQEIKPLMKLDLAQKLEAHI